METIGNEPPAKIVVDPPLADQLSHGRVVIQYRTENLHIAPVFGAPAVAVSPRVGHVHVSVDNQPWVWADASGDAVVLGGLQPGRHEVAIRLQTADHHQLDEGKVSFVVPALMAAHGTTPAPVATGSPPKLVLASPAAEPLARGVAFIPYGTENMRILPVYGAPALAITPPVGHLHITVDRAAWHWVDASGNPIIINGLSAGPHEVLIELVNANHQLVDSRTVALVVPASMPATGGHSHARAEP
jgi:hypothetical protein